MPLIAALLTLTLAHAQEIRTGDALLRAMHERYKSTWYRTLTFTQKSTTYKPDGTSAAETWYEAALLPGKLRIDIGPPANGNGFVLADGTVTVLQNGKIAGTRSLVNILLVLGFDVYRQDPATAIKVVKGEGYNLSMLRDDNWEGHPAYVVGADKGDLKSKQFWVGTDTLLFVRVIEPSRGDPKKVDDIRFIDYRPLAGAPGSRLASTSIPRTRRCLPRSTPISRPTWSSTPRSSILSSSRQPIGKERSATDGT